ncbi:MAG: tetratricopeptide repeat protein, partial [Patescibacteria group bacterium]|nr:tetratricopeptide repeat protein [Patescibacteria group bacterium]
MLAWHTVVFARLALAALLAVSAVPLMAAEAGGPILPLVPPAVDAAFATDRPSDGPILVTGSAEQIRPATNQARSAGASMAEDGPAAPSEMTPPEQAVRVIPGPGHPQGQLSTSESPTARTTAPVPSEGGLIELPSSEQEATLQPIPERLDDEPLIIEAASFKGVTPGVTTMEEVQKAWGAPQEMTRQDGLLVHLYSVEPFDRVEVSYYQNTVTSVIVRFQRAFPAETVAGQLELGRIVPVLVSNELGEILGQVYPERGVLFAFEASGEPGKPSMQVAQIILEPISPESFVLRAETHLTTQYDLSKRDLEYAIGEDPDNARAHWLLSRVHMSLGAFEEAVAASGKAVELAPDDARYRVTRAQVLGQIGELKAAMTEAAKAAQSADQRMHVKARALCLLGDLNASGGQPDYRQALKFHMEAIRMAGSLAAEKHPAVRLAAKEVLIDAHLGAAHDIAWGEWDDKAEAVPRWLSRAAAVVEDVVANESGDEEHRFRVATRALAACVGMRGEVDPAPWTQEALRSGQALVESAAGYPERVARLRWELGMALYDALQVYQMRGEHDKALQFGEQAIGHLEQAGDGP